jgi:hypothetical protein
MACESLDPNHRQHLGTVIPGHDASGQIWDNPCHREPNLMPWLCTCNAWNEEFAPACRACGQPAPSPASAPAQPINVPLPQPSRGIAGWQLAAIGGVLVLGTVFGVSFAVAIFGTGSTPPTPETRTVAAAPAKSTFENAFDASFKNSCRQSAMRSGYVSQDLADRYCDCALSVFHETHSMIKTAETCRQRLTR